MLALVVPPTVVLEAQLMPGLEGRAILMRPRRCSVDWAAFLATLPINRLKITQAAQLIADLVGRVTRVLVVRAIEGWGQSQQPVQQSVAESGCFNALMIAIKPYVASDVLLWHHMTSGCGSS